MFLCFYVSPEDCVRANCIIPVALFDSCHLPRNGAPLCVKYSFPIRFRDEAALPLNDEVPAKPVVCNSSCSLHQRKEDLQRVLPLEKTNNEGIRIWGIPILHLISINKAYINGSRIHLPIVLWL